MKNDFEIFVGKLIETTYTIHLAIGYWNGLFGLLIFLKYWKNYSSNVGDAVCWLYENDRVFVFYLVLY